MERLYNEPLKKHTSFKIGGPPEELVIPENEKELIKEIKRCKKSKIKYRILGKGSNILVNDKGVRGVVIKNTKACQKLKKSKNIVDVGGSVPLQKFTKFCIDNNLEGMEYLFSIPATVGGALYMNAGRGKKHNLSISDNLVSITIFNGYEKRKLTRKECKFDHRYSIFHKKPEWIILEAKFKLKEQPKEAGIKKIKERIDFVNKDQPRKYPSAGTVFKKNSLIASILLNNLKIRDAQIKGNWIINKGNASYKDVIKLIKINKFINYLVLRKPEIEVEIWD